MKCPFCSTEMIIPDAVQRKAYQDSKVLMQSPCCKRGVHVFHIRSFVRLSVQKYYGKKTEDDMGNPITPCF